MPAGRDEIEAARVRAVGLPWHPRSSSSGWRQGKRESIPLCAGKKQITGRTGCRRTAHIPTPDFFLECDGIVTAINQM